MKNKPISGSRDNNYLDILGSRIDLVQIPGVVKRISGWIENKEIGNYIVVANAYDMVAGKKDDKVRNAINGSSLSVPDGISLVLFSRLKGYPLKNRVYGPDLLLETLRLAEINGYSNFFYGSTQKTLDLLVNNLKAMFPGLVVAGTYAPPFRPLDNDEDKAIVEIINKVSPDLLWVGLGTPKQQLWMYEHKDKFKVPVMVGVGAAFDFLAGTKPQAPRWIRDNGFEWLFRLVTEPNRLWRRYLVNYPFFVYYILIELVSKPIKSLLNKYK